MTQVQTASEPDMLPDFKPAHFLGITVHRVNMDETLLAIEQFIRKGKPRHIITADASGVVLAQTDPFLSDLLNNADLITPDSAGILWAAKRFGFPLQGRVSGVEIVYQMCRLSDEKGYRIFFLGAAPGVAELAAFKLRERFPKVNIVGIHDGYFSETEELSISDAIKACKPDVVFAAMGIPKQEKWIARWKEHIGASVYMGVGGSFDVFSGTVKRAPVWMQKINCEWLWRLAQNPKKISKVMTLPKFALMVLRGK